MKKTIIYTTVLPLAVILTIALIGFGGVGKHEAEAPITKTDLKNFSVAIDGDTFALVDGKAEKEYPGGGATKNSLSLFQEPVTGDLDADGDLDGALLLVHNPGGSGIFYYAVLVMNDGGTYKATNVLFLGDRIAPQNIGIQDGRAVYNYAERPMGAMMTSQASVGKSLWVHYDKKTGEIGEWVKDFEGEADPSRMSLDMKRWVWVETKKADQTSVTPRKADAFSVTFGKDGNVAIGTDCNSMGGMYTTSGSRVTFGAMFSTLMFCEGSQEPEFAAMIRDVSEFEFTSKGELILRGAGNTIYLR